MTKGYVPWCEAKNVAKRLTGGGNGGAGAAKAAGTASSR